MDVNLNLDSLCLSDPKNQLQYQLYKTQLSFEQFADMLIPVVKKLSENLMQTIKPTLDAFCEYQRIIGIGAKANPKLAYLACHAKKSRARTKNLTRLYKLGLRIGKSEVK